MLKKNYPYFIMCIVALTALVLLLRPYNVSIDSVIKHEWAQWGALIFLVLSLPLAAMLNLTAMEAPTQHKKNIDLWSGRFSIIAVAYLMGAMVGSYLPAYVIHFTATEPYVEQGMFAGYHNAKLRGISTAQPSKSLWFTQTIVVRKADSSVDDKYRINTYVGFNDLEYYTSMLRYNPNVRYINYKANIRLIGRRHDFGTIIDKVSP